MRHFSLSSRRRVAAVCATLGATVVALLAGCQTPTFGDPARIGPFFAPANHAGDPALPATLRRVVLLPVYGGALADGETAATLDLVFATELQRTNRFEVVVLDRAECRRRFGADEFSSAAALPRDFLPKLRREFSADAILWVDLTAYRAYRPLALGIRAKLATLQDTRLVWTFDNVFSADDPAVANAARRHFADPTHPAVPSELTPAALQSPNRFATYVAAATFATLPPVAPPLAPFPPNPR